MAKKMLIDATHAEEVRVAIVDGNRLEEFDSETSTKRQIKGNIYLAKVIRIEPSLQAAFVEFGGNRHGFLPFGEIHPDYFRIPVSDRSGSEEEVKSQDKAPPPKNNKKRQSKKAKEDQNDLPAVTENVGTPSQESAESVSTPAFEAGDSGIDIVDEDELPRRPRIYHYKIQEVIKRRQIMLIQVVKEERGNKGAALTTYLSLPGRYCVLMPNAGHRGGGISRKISDGTDRRRLRDILKDLEIPEGMSLIVRTAGQERNKLEIRRDFDYLLRLWEEIRETTLKATAPALIYAEGDLIKRSIRDVYNRDIDQILVEGEEAYKAAKAFMKALIPSHTKKVQVYKNMIPLFYRYKVEEQIDAMMNPIAKLPSGGSIVINPTEALVAIDVNSGRSTRERHIDETAVKTNLEAADEIARQMRLRDLAGLVVIDFIDMNEQKHIQTVEKRLREATSSDRARIQLGHISQFGLLELSRQRLRPSILETNSSTCSHCKGTGLVRSVESTSLLVLRAIESEGIGGRSSEVVVTVPSGVDLYLLNQKRSSLTAIESRYNIHVIISRDDTLMSPEFRLETLAERKHPQNLDQLPSPTEAKEEEENTENKPSSAEEFERDAPQRNYPRDERGGRRHRRRHRSFSKRRDQDNFQHKPQDDHGTEKKMSGASVSAEEQILTEISGVMEPPKRKVQEQTYEADSPVDIKSDENKSDDTRNYPRRRRRRGRRNPNRPAQSMSEGGNESSFSGTTEATVPVQVGMVSMKPPRIGDATKLKHKDVVIPATSLPEGIDSPHKKNPQGRWWKRLLES